MSGAKCSVYREKKYEADSRSKRFSEAVLHEGIYIRKIGNSPAIKLRGFIARGMRGFFASAKSFAFKNDSLRRFLYRFKFNKLYKKMTSLSKE